VLIHYGEKLKKRTLADYPELVEQWNYKRNGKQKRKGIIMEDSKKIFKIITD